MTLDEIFAALKTEVGGDKAKAKEIAKQLRTTVPELGQELLNAGAAKQKGEAKAELDRLTARVTELEGELETTKGEFEDHKKKTPDTAAAVATERQKWETKLRAKDDEVTKARQERDGEKRRVRVKAFASALRDRNVDPEYIEVAEQRYGDRIAVGEDGKVKVLQLGEDVEYDAENEEAAIARLADDVKKKVPPRFITTNADRGGGAGGGSGGGSSLSIEQLKEQKRSTGEYAL